MYSNQKGQSLIELVVVIAILVLVITALTFATIASLRNAQFAKNQTQATKLAQEGLEWVRVGRDRNQAIIGLPDVLSWNGNGSTGTSVWEYSIYNGCASGVSGTSCYFKILSDGSLQYLTSSATFPDIAQFLVTDTLFKRSITLSDDSSTFASQKTVTAIVVWSDFSGDHQSRLTTVLRKK